MADRYTYRNERTSIHAILADQRELELNPIRTATERANLQAAKAVAEFQSNLVQDQVKQWEKRDRDDLKASYAANCKLIKENATEAEFVAILEADNQAILAQLKRA